MMNEPVVNEITEDDVNDLSDQIRQLKVLLVVTERRTQICFVFFIVLVNQEGPFIDAGRAYES